ncbi:MAG: hypothetical protein M0Q88_00905 [Bacilli bacterium]|nr:hypothetical protein [Bacilli bacterium]
MPITLNGTQITSNKLNGSDITAERFMGNVVYPSGGTTWTAISNPGSFNGTYGYVYTDASCRTQATVRSDLTSARPPVDYSIGYIMRVTHSRLEGQTPIACTVYYFRCD